MSRQRWGTFSVTDHLRPRPFVAEVLLYDRLIIPVPPDEEERRRWSNLGWNPNRLDVSLKELGDLAIHVPWDQYRREKFKTRFAAARDAGSDTRNLRNKTRVDAMYTTRMLLAQDFLPEMPKGVTAWPVAAYPSCAEYVEDQNREGTRERKEKLSMLLTNRFFVPEEPDKSDPEILKIAVRLAKRDDFIEKRAKFHAWQEDVIEKGIPDRTAVEEMEAYLEQFGALAEKAEAKVYWKFAFVAIPVAIAMATAGAGAPLVLAGAKGLLSVAAFAALDRKPKIDAGECGAAAIIHDIQKTFRPL